MGLAVETNYTVGLEMTRFTAVTEMITYTAGMVATPWTVALAKIRFLQLEMGQRTPDTTTSMVMTALTSSKSAGLAQKYWADTETITYTQPLTVAGLTITGYTESRTTITLQS